MPTGGGAYCCQGKANVANRIQNNSVVLAHSWRGLPGFTGGLDWVTDWLKREQQCCSGVHIHR